MSKSACEIEETHFDTEEWFAMMVQYVVLYRDKHITLSDLRGGGGDQGHTPKV